MMTAHRYCFPLLAVMLATTLLAATAVAQETIVLRNLDRVGSAQITMADAAGLHLAASAGETSGRVLTWDEVETIKWSRDDHPQRKTAERWLADVGQPLFALSRRITVGDYGSLAEPLEKLWPIYRHESNRSALLVAQAKAWSALAHHEREQALVPWLKTYDLLRSRVVKLSDLPGQRRPQFDARTALNWELEPVWFDAASAKAILPEAMKTAEGMIQPLPDGVPLYLASLALTAGEVETANVWLLRKYEQDKAQQLQAILLLQRALLSGDVTEPTSKVATNWRSYAEPLRPLALYWLAQSQLRDPALRDDALLTLLRIPAEYGRQSPQLAAAALHITRERYRDDPQITARIVSELRQVYPATFFGRKQREGAPTAKSRE